MLRLDSQLFALALGLAFCFERLAKIDELAVVLFVDDPMTFCHARSYSTV